MISQQVAQVQPKIHGWGAIAARLTIRVSEPSESVNARVLEVLVRESAFRISDVFSPAAIRRRFPIRTAPEMTADISLLRHRHCGRMGPQLAPSRRVVCGLPVLRNPSALRASVARLVDQFERAGPARISGFGLNAGV